MKNALFIHVPKTAGLSVAYAFKPHGLRELITVKDITRKFPGHGGLSIGHININFLLNNNKLSKKYFDNALKFCFVRNPWDRMVSLFFYLRQRNLHSCKNFLSFCRLVERGIPRVGRKNVDGLSQCNPQVDWIFHEGTRFVDFIGRFEHIQRDFKRLRAKLGCPRASLGKVNVGLRRRNYRAYYNHKSISLVKKIYHRDIKKFGYGF